MPPGPSSGELWGHHLMPAQVDVSFFMPNGMFVPMKTRRDSSLQNIKNELWKEAKSFPLYNHLMGPQFYIFVGVTQDGEREEFYDEMRRLCDLRLFQPLLKLIEPAGNKDEKMFNSKLNFMIGMTLNEFDDSEDLELITFRRSSISHCKKILDERDAKGIEGKVLYHYPPNVHPTPQLPNHIMDILRKDQCNVLISVWMETSSNNRCRFTVKVKYNDDVFSIILETIRRKVRSESIPLDNQEVVIVTRSKNCFLKVCGYEEYLLGNYPVCQYKYIRYSISAGKVPHLMIVDKNNFYSTIGRFNFVMPSYAQKGVDALQSILNQPTKSIWSLEKKMKIKINYVSYVNVKERGEFFVKAGLYQGTESLCQSQSTRHVESTNPKWHQWVEFDIHLKNIPRSARLCLSLCCSLPKKSRKRVEYAMSWCNINLFDFSNRFVSGVLNLCMWSMPPGFDDLLNPTGIAGSNPSIDTPNIQIEFEQLCKSSMSVTFPKQQDISDYSAELEKTSYLSSKFSQSGIATVQEIIARDSLSELSEQDKEFLWNMRNYCKKTPNSLPKLLRAVKWNFRDDVAILYSMLPNWHLINTESAIELLYCYCTDVTVRQFAVKCLDDRLSDCQLSQYLLQLVQALEFEAHMDNALVRYLFKKALNNEHIGQRFFWYLKAGMHHSPKRVYFALILEAYLRSSNLSPLVQQVEAIEKLTKLSEKLKTEKEDVQVKSLRSQLQSPDYLEVLQNFPSPLDKRFILGELLIDQCDVKSSKKRPLLLTWKNPDVMAYISMPEFQIIFKIGDDLRQDMLTLQMFSLMDNIWQSEGLDLRMIPYGCLATGLNAGMIEVVRNAKTVMQVLNKDFRSKELHNWIKEKNKPDTTDDAGKCLYKEAIETFTRSCAGYCVGTFVLGIGDRHPSNIMVTESGQVFHIDFGHFLDHRKKKFGINRERVPFVLTEDFIRVIAKGQDNPEKSSEFKEFMELCGKAYLSLRKHANAFIILFTMMLSCGIPELQSLEDINYIRKTLMVDCRNHEEAFKYFQQQFHEAYGGAWTTKADWFFHWIKYLT